MLNLLTSLVQPSAEQENKTPQPEAPVAAPVAANTNAAPQHMGNPKQEASPAVMQVIMQRFLQDFEYVELDYPVEGSANNPSSPLGYHPHLQFRMCGDDRKSMNPDQINTYLSRHIDRGIYMLKALGFEMDDFYVSPDNGTLSYDVRVPQEKLTEAISEHDVLKSLTQQLQEVCTEARANRQNTQQIG